MAARAEKGAAFRALVRDGAKGLRSPAAEHRQDDLSYKSDQPS
jgi:hypothetical protein